MSIMDFAGEFSRLVRRYTKTFSSNSDPTIASVPLTHKEIMFTVRHVLYGLGIKESDDNNDNSQVKTLEINNEFLINIPQVLTDLKINQDNDKNACRSEDVRPAIDIGSSLSNTFQKTNENEAEISSNVQDENKFTSQLSPTICINNIGRSDTFVCENNQKTKNNNLNDLFEYRSTNTRVDDLCGEFVEPLSEIWISAMSIVSKLDNLKILYPQLNKQIRQLSLKNNICGAIKTKNPTKIRRSITTLPTLTASFGTKREDRRKSTGGIVCNEKNGKSNEPKKVGHAISNMNLSVSKTPTNSPRITKNPKYAHVRSTIPKPINQSKKKEQ